MTDVTWKRVERDIAKFMGGERIPVADRRLGDVKTSQLVIEVKHRATLPLSIYRELPRCYYIIRSRHQDLIIRPGLILFELRAMQNEGISWRISAQTKTYYTQHWTHGNVNTFPRWLLHGIDQALDAAEYHGLIPCVVLHPKHASIKDCLCLLIRKL